MKDFYKESRMALGHEDKDFMLSLANYEIRRRYWNMDGDKTTRQLRREEERKNKKQ